MEKRQRRFTDPQVYHQNAAHLCARSTPEENLQKVEKSEVGRSPTKWSAARFHSTSDSELYIRRRPENIERHAAGTGQLAKNLNMAKCSGGPTSPSARARPATCYAPHPLLIRLLNELADCASCAEIGEVSAVDKLIDSHSIVRDSMADMRRTLARYTHAQSKKIAIEDCVEFARCSIPGDARTRRQMGIWVAYEKKRCTRRGCVRCPKVGCDVCPHVLRCSCANKCATTKWCPHIHVARAMESWLTFDDSACLLIHQSWQRMKMRHLQAVCREPRPMAKFGERVYRERRTHAACLPPRRVVVVGGGGGGGGEAAAECACSAYRVCSMCGACRCRLRCNCFDYLFNGNVCEHCHSVALTWQRNRRQVLARRFDFAYACDDDGEPRAPNGEKRNQLEHERSYGIRRHQMRALLPYLWSVGGFAAGATIFHLVLFRRHYRQRCASDRCHLSENGCSKCRICVHRYLCTCADHDERLICRHMHAVRRMCDAADAFGEAGYESDEVDYNNCADDVEDAVRYFMALRRRTAQSLSDSERSRSHLSEVSSS